MTKKFPGTPRLLFCFTIIALLCRPAWGLADEICLANGDRISGKILHKENGSLTVETAYAGIISINWQQIRGVHTKEPIAVLLTDNRLLTVNSIGDVTTETKDTGQGPGVDEVKYINPPPYITGHGVQWSGRMNAGYQASEGNSPAEQIHLEGTLTARTKARRYSGGAAYDFASDNGTETTSKSRGFAKFDQFLTEKWYATGKASLAKDRFKDLNLRTITGAGLGYQFRESKLFNLAAESGLDYVWEDYRTAPDKEYPALRWGLDVDRFFFKERLQAFHSQQLNIGLEDTEDLLLTTRTGLRLPLAKSTDATIEVDYDWDNQPADGAKRADVTYIFSLGYSW